MNANNENTSAGHAGGASRWRASFFSSLRCRLLLLVLLAIIPALGLSLYTAMEFHRDAAADAHRDALRLARHAAARQNDLINEAHQLLVRLSKKPEVWNAGTTACHAELAGLLAHNPRYANIGIVRPDGELFCSAVPLGARINVAERAFFQRAVETRDFAIGEYRVGQVTGKPSVHFAYPVLDAAGKLHVILFVALDLDWLNQFAAHAELPPGSTLTVIDRRGTILVRQPDPEKWIGRALPESPMIKEVLQQRAEGVTESAGSDGVRRLYAFTPLYGNGESAGAYVCVGIPTSVAFAEANRIVLRNLLLIAAVTIFMLVITHAAVETFIRRRLDPLLAATQQLTRGELAARTGLTSGPVEFVQIARAIDQMAESLRQRETEHRQTLQSLRESEGLFRALSAHSPLGVFMTDTEGHVTYLNARSRQIFGITLMESMGEGWAKRVHADDRQRVLSTWFSFVTEGGDYHLEYRVQSSPDQTHWVETQAAPMRTEDGKLIGYVGTVTDVTERKQAEEALRQSEERNRSIVETARDAIFTISPDGVFTSLNPAFETITGWSQTEWIGKPFGPLVHRDDFPLAMEMFARVMNGEKPPTFELRVRAKNDQRVTVELTVTPQMQDGKVLGVFGIARDTTERKQLEEQLRQAQKMEAVGRLAGGVAHDFNNVLTAITGYSELLLRRLPEDDPHRRSVEEIHKAGNRAASLTRQLLTFSRKQVVQPKVLDLDSVVGDIEKMLRRLIGEDIELQTALRAEGGRVKADPGQIEQVIMNLVVNARDAMPAGGKLAIETANVTLDQEYARRHTDVAPGDYVLLAVRDTGTGMTEQIKAHIFEPFFTTKGQGKGTGLGLATCFAIVKQSGGHIVVDTELGKGSAFKIYLPRVRAAVEPVTPVTERDDMPRGTETILLVEDESVVRELSSSVLRELGYTVLEAANGDEALRLAQQHGEHDVDLLLTDVVMPQMGGRELADKLRAIHPNTKVLFTSGYTEDAVQQRGINDPTIEFLQKPYRPDSLARKVREVLSRRQNVPA